MNSISSIETILTKLSKGGLNRSQIDAALNNPTEFPKELFEEISLVTAQKYWNGKMSFSDGDCIMNNLFNYWTGSEFIDNSMLSSITWECYLAFDSGEFYRSDDDKSIHPSEKYTKPLIENLLRKHNLIR